MKTQPSGYPRFSGLSLSSRISGYRSAGANSRVCCEMHIRKRLLVCLIPLLFVATTSFAVNTEGVTFKSADGKLSVWLPKMPQASEQVIPSQTGGPYKRVTYSVESAAYLFLAGILYFRDDLSTTGDESSYLDTMLGSIKAGFGEQFAVDKEGGVVDLKLPGSNLKGRQLQGTIRGQKMVLRAYVGKHSIYMLQAGFPVNSAAAATTARRFLESIVVTD